MRSFTTALLFAACLCSNNFASAAPTCAAKTKTLLLESKKGSASAVSNLSAIKGSLTSESKEMFEHGERSIAAEEAKNTCAAGCAKKNSIVFRAVPAKLLTKSPDLAKCEKYRKATTAKPITYTNTFGSMDDFEKWFGKFSRGAGEEGADLYKKCDGTCSPQYKITVTRTETGTVESVSSVICGPARDQSNNTYKLSTSLLLTCASAK